MDGVYERDGERLVFRFVEPPSQRDLQRVVDDVARRVMRMLARRGLIGAPRHDNNEQPAVDDAMVGLRKVGLARGRFERIDERGASQPSLFADNGERFSLRKPDRWAAERDGFSVHAGVAFSALDRRGREGLLRYLLRPAIAVERVSILRDGSIAYRTKYKLRSGATARVMTPIELLCRMAALVPPPRIPLLRYHGCLAAASPLRRRIAPANASDDCEHQPDQVVSKILAHLNLPVSPELLADQCTVVYDVTVSAHTSVLKPSSNAPGTPKYTRVFFAHRGSSKSMT